MSGRPITIQDEIWGDKKLRERIVPLEMREFSLAVAFACLAVDPRGDVYRKLARPYKPHFPGEPRNGLENFALIFKRHPEQVLFVLNAVHAHLQTRTAGEVAMAVRSAKPKAARRTILDIAQATKETEDKLDKWQQRRNQNAAEIDAKLRPWAVGPSRKKA